MQRFQLLTAALITGAMTVAATGHAAADRKQAENILAAIHDNDVLVKDIDSDGADRIRYADRLAMLTQRVAAASCALTSDVAVEESYAYLEEAMHEMDIILEALRVGIERLLIIGPEN